MGLFSFLKENIYPYIKQGFCKEHSIEEGWLVQGVRFRECTKCKKYESQGAQLNGRNFKKLTYENSIYVDGTNLR